MLAYVFLVYCCKEQNNNNKLLHSSADFFIDLLNYLFSLRHSIKDGNSQCPAAANRLKDSIFANIDAYSYRSWRDFFYICQ